MRPQLHPRHMLPGALAIALILSACGDSPAPDSSSSPDAGAAGDAAPIALVLSQPVAPGEFCEEGGIRIFTGLDGNGNGRLDEDEIIDDETSVVCNQVGCNASLQITEIGNLEQDFILNQTSAPITIALSETEDVTLRVIAPELDVNLDADAATFTLTPLVGGGPFQGLVLASDGCTLVTESFTVENVAVPTGSLRFAKFYGESINIFSDAITGEELRRAEPFEVTDPIERNVGSAPLTISGVVEGSDRTLSVTPEVLEDQELMLLTYLDESADAPELSSLTLPLDSSDPGENIRLRLINLSGAPSASLSIFGQPGATIETIADGQASAPQTFAAEGLALGIDHNADASVDVAFAFNSPIFEAGGVFDIYLLDDGELTLLAHNLLDNTTAFGREVGTLPLNFDQLTTLPPFISTSPDRPWTIVTSDATSPTQSLKSGTINSNSVVETTLDMELVIPTAGTFSFDWRMNAFFVEIFYFCGPEIASCSAFNASETRSAGTGGSLPWSRVDIALPAGIHTLRWGYRASGAPGGGALYGGWLDTLRFEAD